MLAMTRKLEKNFKSLFTIVTDTIWFRMVSLVVKSNFKMSKFANLEPVLER